MNISAKQSNSQANRRKCVRSTEERPHTQRTTRTEKRDRERSKQVNNPNKKQPSAPPEIKVAAGQEAANLLLVLQGVDACSSRIEQLVADDICVLLRSAPRRKHFFPDHQLPGLCCGCCWSPVAVRRRLKLKRRIQHSVPWPSHHDFLQHNKKKQVSRVE